MLFPRGAQPSGVSKRMGENWETAGAALYLGSRLSSYVTGHIVVSDGGATHTTARGVVAEGQKPRALEPRP